MGSCGSVSPVGMATVPQAAGRGNEPSRIALRPAFQRKHAVMILLTLLIAANLTLAGTFSLAAVAMD
ncbi:hypothetical protein [Methylobacterium sp. J-090]|uniref:hypothetical protein n=1 Tax=Methylobacterium sp. J-090 TaxID=2836666 RepID=UPI001FBACE19|nr:hypothetical protein [Methylobacterium sp. J-090]MCJ2083727.1 hypothetical protein [Methylobacterium sp. J-090]